VIIGTGIDVLEISRFAEAITRHGERFLNRIFTHAELENCQGRIERLAVRFAAKEAVLKAVGTGFSGVTWHDMEVLTSSGGAPVLHLSGHALRVAEGLGVARTHISLSHSKVTAVAVVILES
jgi:holo-[acyl-carrier protein] synthase